MMVALEPIRQAYGLKRVLVSTYQAVSGAGNQAMEELKQQTRDFLAEKPLDEWKADILPCGGDKNITRWPLMLCRKSMYLPMMDTPMKSGK